jgi:hypothetical protein
MMQLPKPPPVSGKGITEQLESMRSYLCTVVDQLNLVLQGIDKSLATLEGRDEKGEKTTTVQALSKKYVAQVGATLGWNYTFYTDGSYDMEKTVTAYPRQDSSNTISGVTVYVSAVMAETLPFRLENGTVIGDDLTAQNRIVDGRISNGGDTVTYRLKSLAYFSGEGHRVHIKISGKIEGVSLILSTLNGGDTA